MMQPGIAVHSGETIAERNSLRVLDCRECGFAHLAADAIPSPEVLARFYARDFWQRDKAGWRERSFADWGVIAAANFFARASMAQTMNEPTMVPAMRCSARFMVICRCPPCSTDTAPIAAHAWSRRTPPWGGTNCSLSTFMAALPAEAPLPFSEASEHRR